MSSLNWSDLIKEAGDTASYEPLPDGDYDFKILESTAKVSQSGKTMFSIKAEVQAGPHAKRLIWDNLVISPESKGALGMFFAKMAALGFTKEYWDTNPTNAEIEDALVGRSFRAQVGHRMWQGAKKNEMKKYYPAATAAPAASPAPAAAPMPPAAPAPSGAPAAPASPF